MDKIDRKKEELDTTLTIRLWSKDKGRLLTLARQKHVTVGDMLREQIREWVDTEK